MNGEKKTSIKEGREEEERGGRERLAFLLTAEFIVIFNYSVVCFYVCVLRFHRASTEKLVFIRGNRRIEQSTFASRSAATLLVRSALCFPRRLTSCDFFHQSYSYRVEKLHKQRLRALNSRTQRNRFLFRLFKPGSAGSNSLSVAVNSFVSPDFSSPIFPLSPLRDVP